MIGKKVGMTQAFDESEMLTPVTVIEVVPCPIVQVKDQDSDGYAALKIGYFETNRLNHSSMLFCDESTSLLSCSPGIPRELSLNTVLSPQTLRRSK